MERQRKRASCSEHSPQSSKVVKLEPESKKNSYLANNQYCIDIPNDETGEVDDEVGKLRSVICKSLWERYRKVIHINYANGPESYCFINEGDSLRNVVCHPVIIIDMLEMMVVSQPKRELYANEWQKLTRRGKADLHRILIFPYYLWRQLEYVKRGNDGDWKERDAADDAHCSGNCISLQDYGDESGGKHFTKFTHRVKDGLTTEELAPSMHQKLVKLWDTALITGFHNDDGHTAVFQLFQELVDLLPHMKITTPVEVLRKTSPSKSDSLLVSSSGSSHKCAPSGDDDVPVRPHRHLADLAVVTLDPDAKFAKYIALIEIHSKGKNDNEAEEKFLEEVMSVLQAQNIVFGFLFSKNHVIYYCAERLITREIRIQQVFYQLSCSLVEGSEPGFFVGSFQRLVMDIIATLVYGVKKIEL